MTAVEITKIPNFISNEDCSLLVEAFERNALTNSANNFWDDMIVYPEKITDSNVLHLMEKTSRRTREVIVKNYKPEEIFSDSIMLCRWDVGKKLTPHIDNQNTHEYSTPWRTYSSLVYLNDNFEGGEIFFPRLGQALKPATGLLVIFSSGAEHEHGVKEVTAGQRYTMPSWYTTDESHKNELAAP
jgi:predicted 2-oxoglutarate/Fe(II)-dependent dioxygenase YbiX